MRLGRPLGLALTLVGLGWLAGCGGGGHPCADRARGEARDWCRFEEVERHVAAGAAEAALAEVRAMDSDEVKAAALARLLSAGLVGGDVGGVEALCDELSEPHRSGCRRTWARPHLWERAP